MSNTGATTLRRTCGSCSLCCKLIGFPELKKPPRQWCFHCAKGGGCLIYASRPQGCRQFNCGWLTTPQFGDDWHPLRLKAVIENRSFGDSNILCFHVDNGSPLIKRLEPYYGQLKQMALNGLPYNSWINLFIDNKLIVVLPDREIDCGTLGENDVFSYRRRKNGLSWEVEILKNGQRVF